MIIIVILVIIAIIIVFIVIVILVGIVIIVFIELIVIVVTLGRFASCGGGFSRLFFTHAGDDRNPALPSGH